MRVPSGDQAGSRESSGAITVRPVPLAAITVRPSVGSSGQAPGRPKQGWPGAGAVTNASLVPSGDHEGERVSWIAANP